jgi:hypothetical protein
MSVFISIGPRCNVKFQINRHIGKKETLFFDWASSDMASVISILGCNNIDDILHFDNIVQLEYKPNHGSNARIIIKSLSHCVFVHDIKINYTNTDIYDFIEKYKRRYERIISYIKNNEKIYFLRYGHIDKDTKNLFIQTIKNINVNCNFILVSIRTEREKNSINKEQHFLEINLKEKPSDTDWTTSNLDWKQIFLYIQQNS